MVKAIILAVLLILTASVFTTEYAIEDDVLVLNNQNYLEAIKEHKYLLLELYAPWCGHCKRLAPEYVKAAQYLKNTEIKLAKIDATVEKDAAAYFKISSYPTLKFFAEGKEVKSPNERTSEGLISWLTKQTGPLSKELNTVAEIEEEFRNATDYMILFIGGENLRFYMSMAKEYDEFEYYHCTKKECSEKYKAAGNIVILTKFDSKPRILDAIKSISEAKYFIEQNIHPNVIELNNKTSNLMYVTRTNSIALFVKDKDSEQKISLDYLTQELNSKLDGKLRIFIIRESVEEGKKLIERVGVKVFPEVRLIETKSGFKNFKYPSNTDFSPEKIFSFIDDWENGRLTHHVKSETIPTVQANAVFKIVGDTFISITEDKTKDVFVKFYAPWCGHCKTVAPIYEELAKKLKDNNPNLIIAEIDVTENDTADFKIGRFPSFFLYSASDKKTKSHNGERTVDGFIQFLNENASFPINTKDIKDDL